MMKKIFFIIFLSIVNGYTQQQIEDWKTLTEQIISSIRGLILTIQITNFDFYIQNKEYFNIVQNTLNKIENLDTIEEQTKELQNITSDFLKILSQKIPKKQKDHFEKLINYFYRLVELYNKNKKFIDDFINGENQFIEEQRRIIDEGNIKRTKATYDPNKILNSKKIEFIMIFLIIFILFLLILIGFRMIKKKNLTKIVEEKSFIIPFDENNNKNLSKKNLGLEEPLI
jgi:hypothetical protein